MEGVEKREEPRVPVGFSGVLIRGQTAAPCLMDSHARH